MVGPAQEIRLHLSHILPPQLYDCKDVRSATLHSHGERTHIPAILELCRSGHCGRLGHCPRFNEHLCEYHGWRSLTCAQQCRPLSAAWTWSKEGQCFDLVTLFLASSPINVLSDLAILYMPLPIITGLRIERTAKIGLVLAFLCGIFVAIVDVGKYPHQKCLIQQSASRTSRPPSRRRSTTGKPMSPHPIGPQTITGTRVGASCGR